LNVVSQLVLEDDFPDLLDLIRLGHVTKRLQIQNFDHAVLGENVVDSLIAAIGSSKIKTKARRADSISTGSSRCTPLASITASRVLIKSEFRERF
jgi:hypothetical protein